VRVLLVAFACRPDSGSEPGAGWAMATGAVKAGNDVVLVTQRRHRDAIAWAIAADPDLAAHLRAHYVGLPACVMAGWDRAAGLRGLQLYYLVWQVPLWLAARKLHRAHPFDVAHHATLTNEWIPSGLSFAGLPAFVWGPLGGGERVPRPCRPFLGGRGRVTEWLRMLTAGVLHATVGRAGARRAALLVAQNDDEAIRLRRSGRPVVVSPNVFLDDPWFASAAEVADATSGREARARPRAVCVGRLLAWKGVHLALQVMAQPEVSHWELHVYGSGPERRRMESEVRHRGLGSRVVFHGPVSRAEVRTVLCEADALLFPSMREAAGWVVAEALGVGCPVVCLDVGGPPLLVHGCGTTVSPSPEAPHDLAQALCKASEAPRTVVRWGAERAPDVLRDWYDRATASEGVARHSLP